MTTLAPDSTAWLSDLAGVRERLISLGGEPLANTPDEFAAFIKAENAKYAKVIRDGNIKAD